MEPASMMQQGILTAEALSAHLPRQRNYARWFEVSLLLATILPFFLLMHLAFSSSGTLSPSYGFYGSLQFLVFLNTIHVPATLYLFSDPHIRRQALASPGRMIAMPLLILFGGMWGYTQLAMGQTMLCAYLQLAIIMGYVYWQMWHCGMQSYGVLSFVSITSSRPLRQPWQGKFEKRSIMVASVVGMLALYHNYVRNGFYMGTGGPLQKMAAGDKDTLASIGDALYGGGMVVCAALTLAAVAYVLRYRRSFTPSAALMYLISVSFFLPDYLTAIIPNATPQNFNISLINFSIVHGIQYMVFLVAHMIGSTENAYAEEKQSGSGLFEMAIALLMPFLMFLLLGLAIGIFIGYGVHITLHSDAPTRMFGVGADADSQNYIIAAATGFSMSLAAVHIWLDQFFWKLSRPAQREWIFSRYKFALPARKSAPLPARTP
jgi:hypothetical protein